MALMGPTLNLWSFPNLILALSTRSLEISTSRHPHLLVSAFGQTPYQIPLLHLRHDRLHHPYRRRPHLALHLPLLPWYDPRIFELTVPWSRGSFESYSLKHAVPDVPSSLESLVLVCTRLVSQLQTCFLHALGVTVHVSFIPIRQRVQTDGGQCETAYQW